MRTKVKCPKCKDHWLSWHMIQGIRLKRMIKDKLYFDVRCPECGDYTIEEGKEP